MNIDGEAFAACARAFAGIHAGRPARDLIANIHARVEMLSTAAGDFPVTIHAGHRGDAWVCSPRSTYIDCAVEEAGRYLPGWAARTARIGLTPMDMAFAGTGLDRAVTLNNWLLSTNLYPGLSILDMKSLLQEAAERWPGHAIWFRSLNEVDNKDWLAALDSAGARPIVSRQVYLYDDVGAARSRHKNMKRDLDALKRTSLRISNNAQIVEADYARIAQLYALLYLDKYSRFNPVYSEAFLREWHRAGLLEFAGCRNEDGTLMSIVGLFRIGCVATAPIVGYDTAQPQKTGLYRLATASAYRSCMRSGWRLNFSAGAADFKRLRGGKPAMEYSMVYADHLTRRTRLAIAGLSSMTCGLGAPLMRRYQL